jgi:hypothetical protein
MATPRFNRIALSFMEKINSPTSESAGVVQGGSLVTTTARVEKYVNRAMHALFNKIWESAEGDKLRFMTVCPELVKIAQILKESGDPTVPGDYFEAIGARLVIQDALAVNIYLRLPARQYYMVTRTGSNAQWVGTAAKPILYELEGTLYLFPDTTSGQIELQYIQMPLKTDGTFITSGGAVDCPFSDQWNEQIAEIAADLYFKESNS